MILNKKYLLAFLIIRFLISSIDVSGQVKTFETTFGSTSNDLGNFVQQTLDGGFIICGAKGDPGTAGYYNYSLIKIDVYGAVQWTNSIGDSANDEQAQCVRQLMDGTYIVYGSHSGPSNSTAWLVKTDENGNKKWGVEQQGSHNARYGYSVLVAADGGYQTASYDNGNVDSDYFQLQKTDASGNIQWGPNTIVKGVGTASSLALTKDGNYISVGTTAVDFDASSGNYFSMITLVKTGASGNVMWTKSYKTLAGSGGNDYLQGFGVEATNDGGYIVCGSTNVNSKGGTDIFLLKTNGNGDSLWSKSYGGYANDVALSVKEVPGGGFILTGNTRSFGSGSSDIFILKTTAAGDSLWMRMFGGTGTETAGNIEVTSDSGFVVIGTTASYGAGQNDILLLRTDSQGRIPDATVQLSGNTPNICNGSTITLTAAAGYSYTWSNGATTRSITVNQTGNYTVTVKDSYNNVNVSKVIAVNVDHTITSASFTVGGPTSVCQGKTVKLTADSIAGYMYQWQANGGNITGATARIYYASEDGEFDVVISNACNSMASPTVAVHIFPLPPAPTITQVGKDLVSSSSTNNQWYRNDTLIAGAVNPTYTPSQNGTYIVTVSDGNHCTAASSPVTLNSVGFEEFNANASYILYPNPASDLIYVDYNILNARSTDYFTVYSADGKAVYREKLDNETGLLKVDIAKLANGIYFSGIETQGAFAGRKALAVMHR